MWWVGLEGSLIGSYILEEEIGQGGVSRVYRARERDTGQIVAVKLLFLGPDTSAVQFDRWFETEVASLLALHHPNIIAMYDCGRQGQFAYIVEQLVDGGTLRNYVGQRMDVGLVCHYMLQICDALMQCHQQSIIHRDLKPANMLLDPASLGHVVLTDFGIAKILDSAYFHAPTTKSGVAIGTPEYMAPEQCKGTPVDARTDIYALGCVLYHLLAGEPPFSGTRPIAVCYQHVNNDVPDIRHKNPDVPMLLAAVITQAVQRDPLDRYQTAADLRMALLPFARPITATAPITQPLPAIRYNTPAAAAIPPANQFTQEIIRIVDRHQWQRLVAVCIVCLMLLGIVVALIPEQPKPRIPPPPQQIVTPLPQMLVATFTLVVATSTPAIPMVLPTATTIPILLLPIVTPQQNSNKIATAIPIMSVTPVRVTPVILPTVTPFMTVPTRTVTPMPAATATAIPSPIPSIVPSATSTVIVPTVTVIVTATTIPVVGSPTITPTVVR